MTVHAHTHTHTHTHIYAYAHAHTVFPQNLATAGFYFKAPFGVATIQGWLDFEGGVYRD